MIKVLKDLKSIISVLFAGSLCIFSFTFPSWIPEFTNEVGSSNLIKIDRMTSYVEGRQENKNELFQMSKLGLDYDKRPITYHLALIDITSPLQVEEKKSDLFYYILGILILIIAAFILRQRYKKYLEEKRNER
jgi:hypothetical protein